MSNACDPRNRPGFVSGDLASYLPDRPSAPSREDDLRTVLLTVFTAALIVAVVFAVVLFAQ